MTGGSSTWPGSQGQRRQSALGESSSCRTVSRIENLEPGQRCKVLIIPTRGSAMHVDLIGARGQPLQRVRYVHAPSIRGEMATRSGSALRCRSHMQAPQNVQWRLEHHKTHACEDDECAWKHQMRFQAASDGRHRIPDICAGRSQALWYPAECLDGLVSHRAAISGFIRMPVSKPPHPGDL